MGYRVCDWNRVHSFRVHINSFLSLFARNVDWLSRRYDQGVMSALLTANQVREPTIAAQLVSPVCSV